MEGPHGGIVSNSPNFGPPKVSQSDTLPTAQTVAQPQQGAQI
jgi:hypothetical protein